MVVYRDADTSLAAFSPSGGMGDVGDVATMLTCRDNPHAGDTCVKVTYTAKGKGPHACDYPGPCRWSGTMWQYPPSNWGKSVFWQGLGRDLSGYSRLTFWARAEKPCSIEVMLGGADQPYGDSLKEPLKETISLGTSWAQYSLALDPKDMVGNASHCISGFGWATNWDANPQGVTFYLDDIVYVKEVAGQVAQEKSDAPGQAQQPQVQPAQHEKLVVAAWEALGNRDYAQAMAQAEKCISQFQTQADALQKMLKDKAIPTGAVTEQEKKEIHAHGVLNDTATAHFIRAQAAKELGKNDIAIESFRKARNLSAGRAWDPKGWFWSPADAAVSELRSLQ